MNVQLAHMFFLATQQATLPLEQRKITPELIYKKSGVDMRKFEVKPYLEEIKDEITISYPKDILAIITERKATARTAAIVGSSCSCRARKCHTRACFATYISII